MTRTCAFLPFVVAAVVAAGPWTAGPGAAQGLNFGDDQDVPITVDAENGIEWQQVQKLFIARGNAVATRGAVTIRADMLRAYYRKRGDGKTDIWRLDAEGRVLIETPSEKAHGDTAVYDVDNAILVLGGSKVSVDSGADRLIADKQIEYWEKKLLMVARGNALAIRDGKRLRADVLTARMEKDTTGKTRIHTVEAFDNVHIVAGDDVVIADRADYDVETSIATLTGSVRITREGHQLRGCEAEVNLKTGISTLKSCRDTGGQGRVEGLLQPRGLSRSKNGGGDADTGRPDTQRP